MKVKNIKIKINGEIINCKPQQTILEVARENGIYIPALCDHPDFPHKANCRVCVVEINPSAGSGQGGKLVTSCSTKAQEGMEIKTDSPRVNRSRNLNLELIYAEHVEKCATCVWRFNCALLDSARRYEVKIARFKDRKGSRKTYKFANAVEIDGTQCIDCRNCVDACSVCQKINYLEISGKGVEQEIVPTKNKKIDCIYCGQCALHCPVSAAQEQSHWEMVEKVIKDEKKIVIAQFAPSIRASIGEEFGLPYGKDLTGKIVTSLRHLGFDYVFDVSFGADLTTMVEAEELLERLEKKKYLPMMTSCCPAWVKYAEFYRPDLIPNLTTSRSPQIHNAGLIKTYWAREKNIDPKNIVVVSIMPCTAKKFEASRHEMKIKGMWPVDYVLTTREFVFMLKKENVKFSQLKSGKADNPLGEYSGAGVIYGVSGGVMESALRTAQFMACKGKNHGLCKTRLEFKDVRGMAGIKEAKVDVGGKKLKVAVVNGIGNVKEVLANMNKYDYIEIMACPGGCVGGGGQPIPTTMEIRKKRAETLYKLDKGKKIRRAHENKGLIEILRWLEGKKKLKNKILYTKYKKRS